MKIQAEPMYNPSEVIEMAWCDKTSFESIERLTGCRERDVIEIMRKNLKPSSFRLWRKRVSGRIKKHEKIFTKTKPRREEETSDGVQMVLLLQGEC